MGGRKTFHFIEFGISAVRNFVVVVVVILVVGIVAGATESGSPCCCCCHPCQITFRQITFRQITFRNLFTFTFVHVHVVHVHVCSRSCSFTFTFVSVGVGSRSHLFTFTFVHVHVCPRSCLFTFTFVHVHVPQIPHPHAEPRCTHMLSLDCFRFFVICSADSLLLIRKSHGSRWMSKYMMPKSVRFLSGPHRYRDFRRLKMADPLGVNVAPNVRKTELR